MRCGKKVRSLWIWCSKRLHSIANQNESWFLGALAGAESDASSWGNRISRVESVSLGRHIFVYVTIYGYPVGFGILFKFRSHICLSRNLSNLSDLGWPLELALDMQPFNMHAKLVMQLEAPLFCTNLNIYNYIPDKLLSSIWWWLHCFCYIGVNAFAESPRLSSISSMAALSHAYLCLEHMAAMKPNWTRPVLLLDQDKWNQWRPCPQQGSAPWDRPGLQSGTSGNSDLHWLRRWGETYSGICGVAVCPSPFIGCWAILLWYIFVT